MDINMDCVYLVQIQDSSYRNALLYYSFCRSNPKCRNYEMTRVLLDTMKGSPTHTISYGSLRSQNQKSLKAPIWGFTTTRG